MSWWLCYSIAMVAKVIPEERKCLVCPNTFLVGGGGNGLRSKKYCSPRCSGYAVERTATRARQMSVAEQAYVAGMIDADGSMGIYGKAGSRLRNRLRMTVANTHEGMLDWLVRATGVGAVIPRPSQGPTFKQQYDWVVTGESATSVLEQIFPYMIVKRARAMLAIEYQVGLKDPARRADVEWREMCRAEMLLLNKRGPVTTDDW